MHRRALHLAAFLLAITPCVALAHGVPPEAYAIISRDAEGPRAVSLSAGVALRRGPQRYQFVCPQAWSDQFASPLAALADGTIVVGATNGLTLLSDDGTLRPHPDPAAVGSSSDVVRSARGVFALRPTSEGSELLAVDAQTVRVLWKDTKSLYSLAAQGDDKLVLVRVNGMLLEQVTVSAADGVELERQTATLDLPADYVFARANATEAYALVVYRTGVVALGSLRMNGFTKLAEGTLSIAGPLNLENMTLVALDGQLSQLLNGQATPLADDHAVICLAEHDGLRYACDSDGIARVNGPALGDPLFRFAWLVPPDLDRVLGAEERLLCNSQWQDLRFDIQLTMPDFGTAPAEPTMAAGGVGAQPGAAGAAGGAGASAAAGGGGAMVVPPPQARDGGTGCATLSGRSAPRAAGGRALFFVLAIASLRWRRGRSRRL